MVSYHAAGRISERQGSQRVFAICHLSFLISFEPKARTTSEPESAQVEFVKLQTEGTTIKAVVPNVPYYETLYSTLGTYATDADFNEAEQLSIQLLCHLSRATEKLDTLRSMLGAENKLLTRAIDVGKAGAYVRVHRSRGRDVALSPMYFSENAEIYADTVARAGSNQVKKLMNAVRAMQGIPLSIVQNQKEIAGVTLADDELGLLLRLAQDGAVKPQALPPLMPVKTFSYLPQLPPARRSRQRSETFMKRRWHSCSFQIDSSQKLAPVLGELTGAIADPLIAVADISLLGPASQLLQVLHSCFVIVNPRSHHVRCVAGS
jgi:hypothetical protein